MKFHENINEIVKGISLNKHHYSIVLTLKVPNSDRRHKRCSICNYCSEYKHVLPFLLTDWLWPLTRVILAGL